MKYATVCSGIEAPSVAAEPLDWKPVWFSEIEPFPCRVLSHHYPNVPNLGDMTKITKEQMDEHGPVDVFVGGTPCQSFSIAGLRKGLADPRGNLALEYLRIADALRPRFVVWENVPGVLSSSGGRDFESLLTALAELGYGWAYRVLDAQHFGVAQRRRRVFVVGCAGGDWQRAAEILFERESVRGDSPPSREAGEDVAACLTRGVGQRYDPETKTLPIRQFADLYNSKATGDTAATITTQRGGPQSGPSLIEDLAVRRLTPRECERLQGFPDDYTAIHGAADTPRTIAPCFEASDGDKWGCNQWVDSGKAIIGPVPEYYTHDYSQDRIYSTDSVAPAQNASGAAGSRNIREGLSVRRITPRECERLQGFPDDYTAIHGAADMPRHKALGNSMAVPVMRWIFERIDQLSDSSGSS